MSRYDEYVQIALEHTRSLAETIGGRGSCSPEERQAAMYVAEQMCDLDMEAVGIEPYQGAPSTYRPYALAFSAAVLAGVLAVLLPQRGVMGIAALLSAAGAWGMLAETDFTNNWMRLLLPRGDSQNAIGFIPASGEVRRRAVLCAHLDTHRTPVFYSSTTWQLLFSALVGASFVSMVIAAVAFGLGALLGWDWVRWIGLGAAAVTLVALGMSLHADRTPFSPGANDNGSGVGVALALAERLVQEPLAQTEVWLAFTGCEEAAAYGMEAFLDAHAAELGEEAVYIILDQVGLGRLTALTADGLVFKRRIHKRALELLRHAAAALPEAPVKERAGIAYTDAVVATKRGLAALSLVAVPSGESGEALHWHQMSDTLEHVDPQALANTFAFTWQLLQEIDRNASRAIEGGL